MNPSSIPLQQVVSSASAGPIDGGSGKELPTAIAAGALPKSVSIAIENDLLASLETRLTNEVTDLVSALDQFSRATKAISKELPLSSELGKNVTLFLSLASSHVAYALFKGRDMPLLIDDGALQLREMGLSFQEFVRELDLDGQRFLAVALVDQQAKHFCERAEAGQAR